MTIEVFGADVSAPCRLVYMTCEMLGIEYKKMPIDLMKGETRTPEFLKLNPQHTIPAMRDGDFTLCESKAMAMYLCNKYAKDGSKLYPKDPQTRAKIDDRLFFEATGFYTAFAATVYPAAMGGETITQAAKDKFKEACEFANENVKKTGYAAETDNLTLADLAFVSSYSSMVVMDHVDMGPYPELVAWFDKVKKEIKNYDEANGKGAQIYGDMFNAMLKKANQK